LVANALVENPHQQIMILAHNRCLLESMYNIIKSNAANLHARLSMMVTTATEMGDDNGNGDDGDLTQAFVDEKVGNMVGYYLGGMKEADLKASESKTVILATYAMAAEALDIKTLTTLILATSKSNIIQSVGRILRAKNRSSPVIYDIVDTHPTFKNQWKRSRLAFYKKEKYQIMWADSTPAHHAETAPQWTPLWSPTHGHCATSRSAAADNIEPDMDDGASTSYSKCML
jgi:hypothetical protein